MKKMKKSLLPLGVMVLGALAAFASQSSPESEFVPEYGYATINPSMPCAERVECDDTGSVLCTVLIGSTLHTAYGKENPNDSWCKKELFVKQVN